MNNNPLSNGWNNVIITPVPKLTRVIAISVTNNVGSTGLKAALSDGSVVIDGSWKYMTTLINGWQNLDFDDSKWPDAIATQSSSFCPEFPASTQLIWGEKTYRATITSYCRKTIIRTFSKTK